MKKADSLETSHFESRAAWEAWLDAHHADAPGLWLKLAKAASGIASVTYAEALEAALCYGWIDGQKASHDEQYWLQKFTPRRARSGWSRVNREKASELIASGRMRAAGLRQVELAQADGRWDAAYASQRTIEVPPDLESALEAHPAAQAFFRTLDSANRYAILYRVHTAKRPETRAARIQQCIAMLERGEKFHP
jgi:uncharacterized protein YdeI (YjbR/CyaY-like superfamily)